MMKPKCPNCGSTAQVAFYGATKNETTQIRIYKCGCGCIIQQFWKLEKTACYDENGKMLSISCPLDLKM